MSRNKIIIWSVLVILVCLVIYRILTLSVLKPKEKEKETVYPVQVVQPAFEVISNDISLIGEVKGQTEVQVRPKTMGRVEEVYAEEGDEVKKGTPLMSFKAGITKDDPLYNDLVTFSPVAGVVGVKNIKQGEQVVSSMGTINSVYTIYQINLVKIYANIPERFVAEVSAGLPATIRFDSYPGQEFKGRVKEVRPVMEQSSRTVQVEIWVNNPRHLIKPGMFARIKLSLKHKIRALIIPNDAILEDVSKYVLVVKEGVAVKKDIQTGVIGNNITEVTVGLDTSDQVIIVGQKVAQPGSLVEIKPND